VVVEERKGGYHEACCHFIHPLRPLRGRVQLTDPETGKTREIRLSRDGVAQTVRSMLYNPSSAAELPLRVHLAAQGDWKPLAERAVSYVWGLTSDISQGYFLSVTCAEDLPFIRDAEIPAAVAGTFLGDFRIRNQRAACAGWPAARVPESFLKPVVSDVPSLVIAGELDPATPPEDGAAAARTLRHSRYVLVPGASHGLGGLHCETPP